MVVTRVLSAFTIRDWRITRSYRLAWLMDTWSSIFQLFMFYFLSRIVTLPATVGSSANPVDYFPFVVIGLSILGFLSTGMVVFANSLQREQSAGTLEVLLTLPVPPTLTMFGVAMYGFGRSLLLTCVSLTIAAVFFGLRVVADPVPLLVAFVALVASIVLFASLGIVVAAFAIVFKRAQSFIAIVTQVIGLLSGVFYPVELLPRPLQILGQLIPVTWSLDVLRTALLAGEYNPVRVLALVASSIVALPVALWIFHLGVQRARQDGSLGHY